MQSCHRLPAQFGETKHSATLAAKVFSFLQATAGVFDLIVPFQASEAETSYVTCIERQ